MQATSSSSWIDWFDLKKRKGWASLVLFAQLGWPIGMLLVPASTKPPLPANSAPAAEPSSPLPTHHRHSTIQHYTRPPRPVRPQRSTRPSDTVSSTPTVKPTHIHTRQPRPRPTHSHSHPAVSPTPSPTETITPPTPEPPTQTP